MPKTRVMRVCTTNAVCCRLFNYAKNGANVSPFLNKVEQKYYIVASR